MQRAVLLIAAKEGTSADDFEKGVSAAFDPIAERARAAGLDARLGFRLPDDPLRGVAEGTGRNVSPLDAFIEISGDDADTLISAVGEGFGSVAVIDDTRSAAALGIVHEITPGTGTLVLTLAARRLPTLTAIEFQDYWLKTHAPLALSLMPGGATDRFGYKQLHSDQVASKQLGEAAGFGVSDYDGVLLVYCTDPMDFLSVAAEPTFAQRIYEDELNFGDQAEMRGAFVRLG